MCFRGILLLFTVCCSGWGQREGLDCLAHVAAATGSGAHEGAAGLETYQSH